MKQAKQANPMMAIHRRYPRLTAVVCILVIFTLACLFIFPISGSTRSRTSQSFDPLSNYQGIKFTVLVTGGAGFIGSHVVEYFNGNEKCERIIVLDNLLTGKMKNIEGFKKVKFIKGTIEDQKLFADLIDKYSVQYIFHLAALISVAESMDKPVEYMTVNSIATLNLLKIAEKSRSVKRLVFASSAALYGSSPTVPKLESDVPDCESPYAVSKLDGEYFCKITSRTTKRDFLAISMRFFNVFGERQDPNSAYAAVIPNFIRNACLKKEKMTIFGDGGQTRDFVYVKDVVNALIFMAFNKKRIESKVKTELMVYNVGYEQSTTINDLADVVHEMCSEKKSRKRSDYIEYGEARKGDVRHSLASSKKLRNEGWRPKYDFKESLKRTVDWFLKNL